MSSIEDNQTHIEKNKKVAVIATVSLLALVIFSTAVYLLVGHNQVDTSPAGETQEYSQTTNELLLGNQEEALAELKTEITTMNTNTREELELKLAYASSLFVGSSFEDKREAVELMQSIVENDTISSRFRAIAVNTLIWAAYRDLNHFADEEFPFAPKFDVFNDNEKYLEVMRTAEKADGDQYITAHHTLMHYLANYSYNLHPTPFSALFLANWQSHLLLGTPYRENIDGADPEEVLRRANMYISEADTFYYLEKSNSYTLKESDIISNLYWKGVILGDIMIAGYIPEQSFEDSFKQALEMVTTARTIKNNVYPNYADFIHFYYAVYLHHSSGEERREDIDGHVSQLLESVSQNQDTKPGSFRSFLSVTLKEHQEGRTSPRYDFVIELASASSDFREFLTQRGWDL
jgi:hypothetical protein